MLLQTLKNKLIFFFLCVGYLSHTSNACSFKRQPLSDLDKAEFVFIGKVTGYTHPIEFPERRGTEQNAGNQEGSWYMARGLTVQIKEVVSVPGSPPKSIEIFPYFHSGACASLGIGIERLQITYPVGIELLVVAKLATNVPQLSLDGTLRLEIAPSTGVLDSASRLTNYQPTATSVFNYGSLGSREAKFELRFGLLPFEIRKDLLRLEKAKTFEAKTEVIDRLSALGDPVELLNLFSIYRNHTPDKKLAYELYEKKLRVMGFDERRIKSHLKCVQEWADGKRDRPCR